MGFTLGNFFDKLNKKYLPKVPVYVTSDTREVWDTNADYIIKLDITGLDLYPDFGSLPDTGAFYDLDGKYFHWYDDSGIGLTFTNTPAGKKMKEYLESISPDEYILLPDDFSGEDSMRILGTAVVDGRKLQGRIVSYTKKDDEMKLDESTKFTLTIGQLRRLIQEATEEVSATDNITKMDNGILRLNDKDPKQRALCWNLKGYAFTHEDLNPEFDKGKPYMVMCYQRSSGWQMHFENFETIDAKPYMDAFYKAFTSTCEEKGIREIYAVGGFTPGGISGGTALQNYGFKKVYQPVLRTKKEYVKSGNSNIYWSEGMVDKERLQGWLNGGKHLGEFLVIDNPEATPGRQIVSVPDGKSEYNLQNTMPRPFKMVR